MHILILLFLSNLFSSDMVIIIFVALLLFGGEKLPEIARGLGKGIRDFKDASEGVKREINNQINSFEEKKSEEAAVANHIAQSQLPENTPVVENTIPVSENHYSGNETVATDTHAEGHSDPVPELHPADQHEHASTTNELPKNTPQENINHI